MSEQGGRDERRRPDDARDADETYPLRTEEEATEVVEYLRWLERQQDAENPQ